MKASAIVLAFGAIAAAIVTAAFLGMRAQANAESASNALVMAERRSLSAHASAAASVAAPAPVTSAVPVAITAPPASAVAIDGAAPSAAVAITYKQTSTYNGAPVFVPESCAGAYDVLLHFHGAYPYVKDLAEKAKLNAVVAVFNAGNGAEKYAQAYAAGGTLTSLLRQIEMAAAPVCGANAKPRRVALSGWSAGYAAVEKLLTREEDRARVDVALLADGLHAGFTDRYKRTLAPNALQAFRDFGELAKQKQKLFAITHSSIMTDGYGSTTECSRFLMKALNVPCDDPLVSGEFGNFSVAGFTGDDRQAHIVQFRQMDTTLLSKLRERWQD
jgi:hypothetical protein